MKVVREAIGLGVACCVGVLLPMIATLYDSTYRYEGSFWSAWHDPDWRNSFKASVTFIAEGSVVVGFIAGGAGVYFMRAWRYTQLRAFAIGGGFLGAVCGLVVTGLLHHQGDPAVAWVVFTILPALSMALGFCCYWFICIKNHIAQDTGPELRHESRAGAPPADAVRQSSETMNTKPESKAPADGGGRRVGRSRTE